MIRGTPWDQEHVAVVCLRISQHQISLTLSRYQRSCIKLPGTETSHNEIRWSDLTVAQVEPAF